MEQALPLEENKPGRPPQLTSMNRASGFVPPLGQFGVGVGVYRRDLMVGFFGGISKNNWLRSWFSYALQPLM
jgi:hypothetical protein